MKMATLGMWVSVLFVVDISTGAIDKSDLFERIKYASTSNNPGTLQLKGELIELTSRGVSNSDIEKMVAAFKDRITSEFESGTYQLNSSEIEELEQNYKTSDISKLKDTPEYIRIKNFRIETETKLFRNQTRYREADIVKQSNVQYWIDGYKRARAEKTYTVWTEGGVEDIVGLMNSHVYVVNPESSKRFQGDENLMAGFLRHGSDKNMGEIMNASDGSNFSVAGKSFLYNWSPDDVVSVSEIDYEGNKAVKVVMARDSQLDTGQNVRTIIVSPEFNYCTLREDLYLNGLLSRTEEYSNFKELQQGQWYPFGQKKTFYESALPVDIRNKLNSKEIEYTSDIVLASQIISKSSRNIWEFKEVNQAAQFDEKLFDLTFPKGTHVFDSREGNMIQYIVGGLTLNDVDL